MRLVAEVLEAFGPIRSMSVESHGSPAEGSLGAHLYAGLDLVLSLMGEPETIDAPCAMLSVGKTVRAIPGESLRDLHGDITASLRFVDGRAAGLTVSDQGGRWGRTVMLLGEKGRIRIFDDGFEWIGPDGKTIDETRPRKAKKGEPVLSAGPAAFVDGLSRLLDPGIPEPGPSNHAAVLTLCQTALLSARTGQGESPSTIRRMVGVD
jgi:predicted dehydrogenase